MRLVTLGIVAYNTDPMVLARTIQSCAISDCLDLLVVVLCNSPDNNYQLQVSNICKKYDVEFMGYQPNNGFGAGHNLIHLKHPSQWYVCCNPDVEIARDTISKMIKFANDTPDAVQITPRILSPDGSIQPLARRHLTPGSWLHRQLWRIFPGIFTPFEITFDYKQTQPIEFVSGAFFLIDSIKFTAAGKFDEKFFLYAEDADLSFRCSKLGRNYFFADTTIMHRWSTKWLKNPTALHHELKSLLRLFIKRLILTART